MMLQRFIDLYMHAKDSSERAKLITLAKKWLRMDEFQDFCKLTGAVDPV